MRPSRAPIARAWLALLLLACALGCKRIEGTAPERPLPQGPNLLLVTIDTLRADHVGAYGAAGARTPTLDGLAREGVRAATAIAPAPLTVPSHASLFTGLYPPRHGMRHNAMFRLEESTETLAQRLHRAGYATGAVVGAVVLARESGLDRGFEHYDDEIAARLSARAGYHERRAERVNERALAWLARTRRPFFLWVHYFDPHAEYDPPAPFAETFAERPYDGEVAYVDAALGRLLAALESEGRLAETLVVVTSDHGESLGEHGEGTHGYTLYDATLAVPLLLRGPGVPRGAVLEQVVSLVDVAPTILGRLGLDSPSGLDGRDLAPLWKDPSGFAARPAYAESLATQLDHGWSPLHAVRSRRFLYVRAPRPELYDTDSDAGQVVNLVARDPERAQREVPRFEALLDRMLADAPPLEPLPIPASTRQGLRALGYAVSDGHVAESRMDPKDGLLWAAGFELAVEDYLAGELERPEQFLTAMLVEMPSSALAHGLLAAVYLAAGEAEEGLPHAEAALRLAPRSADHASLLGDIRRALGDFEAAREAYDRASQLDPLRSEIFFAIMELELARGRHEEAEAAARSCVALDPEDPRIWQRIGEIWDRAVDPQRALGALREVLRRDPESERAHAMAALQLLRLGERDEAEAHLRAAPHWSQTPQFLNRLAIAQAAHGDPRLAEEIFRDLIAREPQAPQPRHNLATLLRNLGREDEARAIEASAPAP